MRLVILGYKDKTGYYVYHVGKSGGTPVETLIKDRPVNVRYAAMYPYVCLKNSEIVAKKDQKPVYLTVEVAETEEFLQEINHIRWSDIDYCGLHDINLTFLYETKDRYQFVVNHLKDLFSSNYRNRSLLWSVIALDYPYSGCNNREAIKAIYLSMAVKNHPSPLMIAEGNIWDLNLLGEINKELKKTNSGFERNPVDSFNCYRSKPNKLRLIMQKPLTKEALEIVKLGLEYQLLSYSSVENIRNYRKVLNDELAYAYWIISIAKSQDEMVNRYDMIPYEAVDTILEAQDNQGFLNELQDPEYTPEVMPEYSDFSDEYDLYVEDPEEIEPEIVDEREETLIELFTGFAMHSLMKTQVEYLAKKYHFTNEGSKIFKSYMMKMESR